MEKEPTNAELLRIINKQYELDKEHRQETKEFLDDIKKTLMDTYTQTLKTNGRVNAHDDQINTIKESVKNVEYQTLENTKYRKYIAGGLAVITFAGGGIVTFVIKSINEKIETQFNIISKQIELQKEITDNKISEIIKETINQKVISAEYEK